MANVVVALDPNPQRRRAFLEKARWRIAPFPDLAIEHREGEGWVAIWAASPRAPVSIQADGRDATFVWGDAIDPKSGQRLSASEARCRLDKGERAAWDGFHLAIAVDATGRLSARVDIMGLMPLHHWQGSDVVLVGTSVDAFQTHPSFCASLDGPGLVGVLLTNGLVGGRTLLRGVRRLGVRKRLEVRDGKVAEVAAFDEPEPDRSLLALPPEGHVELLGEALDASMRRFAQPGEPHGILLSGGLDSRQLGGFLVDRECPGKALTFGRENDLEMRCAKKVAAALGTPHQAIEIPADEYEVAAERLARYEVLAAGFGNVLDWAMVPHLERLPPRVLVGHVFDGLVGGIHIPWAFQSGTNRYAFETVFERFNQWGFSPEALRELLVPDLHPVVDEVLETIRTSYHSTSAHPNLQAWHFDLQTRQRFHVGAALWPMTFRGWPVSPIFDSEVFRLAASMPASGIAGRRLQKALLVARHPRLAAIPLDRNSYDTLPLAPSLSDLAQAALRRGWKGLPNRIFGRRWGREERFYYRTYDFHSPGWSAIRDRLEPHRQRIPGWLRSSIVDRHLPRPGGRLHVDDGIVDASRSRLLLGIAWASEMYGLS